MRWGVSTRADGSMRLFELTEKGNDSLLAEILTRRRDYFARAHVDERKVVSGQLVHGKRVALVDDRTPAFLPATDGLITSDTKTVLSLTVADCFPVFFFDARRGRIGLAHIGWRGAALNIAREMVTHMTMQGGVPGDIQAIIGPGICGTHYSLPKQKLTEAFYPLYQYPEALREQSEQVYLDISAVITTQLEAMRIRSIIPPSECTFELPAKYFSYRRDRPAILESQVAWISLE